MRAWQTHLLALGLPLLVAADLGQQNEAPKSRTPGADQTALPALSPEDLQLLRELPVLTEWELLRDWERTGYAQELGPGVYDIHSPRVPATGEMADLLAAASEVLDAGQIWVTPDCGLKTRGWDEVEPSLRNMVEAAKQAREQLASTRE